MKLKFAILVWLFVFTSHALAVDYPRLNQQVVGSKSVREILAAIIAAGATSDDPELTRLVHAASKSPAPFLLTKLKAQIKGRASFQSGSAGSAPLTNIKAIKANPVYADSPNDEENWLGKALSKIKFNPPKMRRPSGLDVSPKSALSVLVIIVWTLLAIALSFLIWFVARHFSLRRKAKSVHKLLLEADEPDRTYSEWLAEASRLEAEGRIRDAVRCLYLACLLQFDAHRVARFDRTETNWQHLRRIQASANLPNGLDFTPTTRAFDLIWYGFQVTDSEDLAKFREFYHNLEKALQSPLRFQ